MMTATNHWVLIRGIASEEFHWWRFREQLQQRFPSDMVSAVDILGNGRTHAQVTPLSVRRNIESLRARAEPGGRKILVGFSLGGMLAAEWACRHPGEVAGVVLINASFSNSLFHKRMRPSAFWKIARLAFHKDPAAKEEKILSLTTSLLDEERKREIAAVWGPRSTEYPVKVVSFVSQMILAGRIRQKKLPPQILGLVLSSGKDKVVHPGCSESIARRWNLELHRNQQAGHDLTLDDPRWVLERLGEWGRAHGLLREARETKMEAKLG